MRIGKTETPVTRASDEGGFAERPIETATAETTALATFASLNAIVPAEFFAPGGSDPVLESLEQHVRAQAAELDISSDTGRAAIASLAYKVARSKTALDDEGKRLVEDQKRALGEIDAERRRVRERLDALKEEVRKPLTDWEMKEKARVADHEAALKEMETRAEEVRLNWASVPVSHILSVRESFVTGQGRDWHEFAARASATWNRCMAIIDDCAARATDLANERAEAERLRRENEERQRREREERIAQEARDAERRAAEERERIAREAAEQERQRIERERNEAEARARQAEARRIEAEQRAARELQEAEERRVREAEYAEQKRIAAEKEAARMAQLAAEKAERDRQAAIEAERARVAEEQRKEREAAEARERNKRHREKVLSEAAAGIAQLINMSGGIPVGDIAHAIASAIAKGQIPHCTVEF